MRRRPWQIEPATRDSGVTIVLREPNGPLERFTPKCPACRLRGLPGFMKARVGATTMQIDDAPANISWPLVCGFCGYADDFGFTANPLPALLPPVRR